MRRSDQRDAATRITLVLKCRIRLRKGVMVMPKKPRILCVDDKRDSLLVRKLLLEQFGCEVIAVNDGRSCLDALHHAVIDLVLIDYHLAEETNGEQLARSIRASSPKLPLIMLTGDPKIPDSVREAVDAVLIKGASNPDDLFYRIEELVPGASLRPRQRQAPLRPASKAS